jgi:hypothetical protein
VVITKINNFNTLESIIDSSIYADQIAVIKTILNIENENSIFLKDDINENVNEF